MMGLQFVGNTHRTRRRSAESNKLIIKTRNTTQTDVNSKQLARNNKNQLVIKTSGK
tara:strand:- start:418 stop:585 length:168 start_codon:yes stop_codon:yes gene_type:complete